MWRGCRITHGSCVAKGSLGRKIFFPPLPFLQGGKRGRRRRGGEKSLFASLCNSEGEEEGRKGAWNAAAAKAAKKGSKRRKSFNIRGRAGMRSGWSEEEEEVGAPEAAKGRRGGRVRAVDKEEKTSGRDYMTATKPEIEAAEKKGGVDILRNMKFLPQLNIPCYSIANSRIELGSIRLFHVKIVTRPTFRPPPPPPGPEETSSPPPPATALSPPPPPPMASLEVLCSDVERCFSPNSKRG